jgi:hypothetical protein
MKLLDELKISEVFEFEHIGVDGDCGGADSECMACGVRDCPYSEPLHYHHDGCPACTISEEKQIGE